MHDYTPSAVALTTIPLPDDGVDQRKVSTVNGAFQSLADAIKFLVDNQATIAQQNLFANATVTAPAATVGYAILAWGGGGGGAGSVDGGTTSEQNTGGGGGGGAVARLEFGTCDEGDQFDAVIGDGGDGSVSGALTSAQPGEDTTWSDAGDPDPIFTWRGADGGRKGRLETSFFISGPLDLYPCSFGGAPARPATTWELAATGVPYSKVVYWSSVLQQGGLGTASTHGAEATIIGRGGASSHGVAGGAGGLPGNNAGGDALRGGGGGGGGGAGPGNTVAFVGGNGGAGGNANAGGNGSNGGNGATAAPGSGAGGGGGGGGGGASGTGGFGGDGGDGGSGGMIVFWFRKNTNV